MEHIEDLKKQGLTVSAIASLTGFDRKTIRKYLAEPGRIPEYRARPKPQSKLEPHKAYIAERLQAGVWNAVVLMRELRERGYSGGYTILKEHLRPMREASRTVAVRRFETPPGKQAQVDWGHLGTLTVDGDERKLWGFTFTLGYSRAMMAEAATDQKLGTLLRKHEEAFRQLGGVPEEIQYDRMRTVWNGTDERGEFVWNPVFLDFARYWGFKPRLCRPYRAQTKGKVESGVKYVRRNFLCGLQGREPATFDDLNAELRKWVCGVANQRIHGTTHEQVAARWTAERGVLGSTCGRPAYPYADDELRKVATDAYVAWDGSRYSVPWQYAGKEVWVHDDGGRVAVQYGSERIAVHESAGRKHSVITQAEHHREIPLGARKNGGKILIEVRQSAPVVEIRPLAAYEAVAGGAR